MKVSSRGQRCDGRRRLHGRGQTKAIIATCFFQASFFPTIYDSTSLFIRVDIRIVLDISGWIGKFYPSS